MEKNKRLLAFFLAAIVLATAFLIVRQVHAQTPPPLSPDASLSVATGAACADCHEPSYIFYDPRSFHPIPAVALPGLPAAIPTAAPPAEYNPIFYNDTIIGLWVGEQAGMPALAARFADGP